MAIRKCTVDYTGSLKIMEAVQYRQNGLFNLFDICAVPRITQVLLFLFFQSEIFENLLSKLQTRYFYRISMLRIFRGFLGNFFNS